MIIYDRSPLADYFQSFESEEAAELIVVDEVREKGESSDGRFGTILNRVIRWFEHSRRRTTRTPQTTFLDQEKHLDAELRGLLYASPLLEDRVPKHFVQKDEDEGFEWVGEQVQEGKEEDPDEMKETSKNNRKGFTPSVVAVAVPLLTVLASFWRPVLNRKMYLVLLGAALGGGFCGWKGHPRFFSETYQKEDARSSRPLPDISILRSALLDRTRELIQSSNRMDSRINRVVKQIQEVELVARGYRLSNPLPPISRIEQLDSSRRCRGLRLSLSQTLTTASDSFQRSRDEFATDSRAGFDESVPVLPEDDVPTLEILKIRFGELHFRRRQCLESLMEENSRKFQQLASKVYAKHADDRVENYMTESDLECAKVWTNRMGIFVSDLKGIVQAAMIALQVRDTCSSSFSSSAPSCHSTPPKNPLIHRLAALDRLLRTARVRVQICAETVTEGGVAEEEYRRLGEELKVMVQFWEEESTESTVPNGSALEMPTRKVAWRSLAAETKPMAVHQYDYLEEEEGEEGKEDVFEGVAGVVEGSKNLLSRSERILESKRKRQEEAETRLQREKAKSTSEKMVSELKNVLAGRKGAC